MTRNSIFRSSPVADNFIASIQQGYANDFDLTVSKEAATVSKYYDHLTPYHAIDDPVNNFGVLVYRTSSLKTYIEEVPGILNQFLQTLNIKQLFVLDMLHTPFDNYPFQNFKKRNDFRRIMGRNLKNGGYLIDTGILKKILTLFFFSGFYGRPVIFFIPADGDVSMTIHLCDDGNFHLNFQEKYASHIAEAAITAGFIMGDLDLCWDNSIYRYATKQSVVV